MRFSKEKWLEAANKQVEQGFLSERERDHALKTWVAKFDGKTREEIGEEAKMLNASWFE